jgi:hypothetical protein
VPIYESYNNQLGSIFTKIMKRETTAGAAMDEFAKQLDTEMAEKYGK